MDHVISVPTDLRDMKNIQILDQSIHRTAGIMSLNAMEVNEIDSQISGSSKDQREGSDEANTSELAQVSLENLADYFPVFNVKNSQL